MGSKRSYDSQEPLQLPCKYLKQSESDEKLISYADERLAPIASMTPSNESIDKPNIPAGCNGFKASHIVDPFEFVIHEVRNVVDKGLVDGRRFPWITDSYGNGDGDVWCRDFRRSLSPDCFHSNSPRRAPVNVGNALSSFLDRYPRKQVPVGSNYQADLSEGESPKAGSSGGCALISDQVLISDEEKLLMGTCVIPMPDSSLPAQNSLPAGAGRKDCECVDNASVRCVRQHVKEARDKLVKALGEDTFQELGLLDMGEEVAHLWSKEEEQVFHEVVFSNPASLGRDFWSCLSEEFPTRSYRDLVSYYFNVFMLRKRAAQNRSRFLDIDSDDNEWHPGHGRSYGIGSADDNDDKSKLDDDSSEEGHYSENDDVENNYSDEEESTQLNLRFLPEESKSFPINHDDSWTSLELQSDMNNNKSTKSGLLTKDLNGLKTQNEYKNSSSDQTESDDGLYSESSDDSNNFRQWNQGFSASLDHLLPTHDMIEEIFGPGSWDSSPNHD